MSQKSSNFTALLILTFLLLNLSCCDDCPTCPEPELEKAYYVYIADDESADPNYIWVVNSKTDSLFDSVQVEDGQIWFMRITSDGKHLAIANFSKDSIYIMDTETREIVGTTPYGHPVEFSYDDKYLLVERDDSLLLRFSTRDWTLASADSVPFKTVTLFNTTNYLLGDISWAGKEYAVYDYLNDSIIKTDSLIRPDGSTPQYLELIMSPDDRHIYFSSRPDKLFKFDIEDNLLIDSVQLFYGAYCGEIHNGPDGQYLFVAEVAQSPTPALYGVLLLVKQGDFAVYRRYSTWGLNPNNPIYEADIGRFEITPDGKKIYGYKNTLGIVPPVSLRVDNGVGSFIHGYPVNRSGMALAIGKEIR